MTTLTYDKVRKKPFVGEEVSGLVRTIIDGSCPPGRRDALEGQILSFYSSQASNIIQEMFRSIGITETAVSEGVFEVIRKLRGEEGYFESPWHFENYFFGTVIGRAIDYKRREEMIKFLPEQCIPGCRASEDTPVGENPADTLSTLPEEHRDILEEVYIDGRHPKEVLEGRGISKGEFFRRLDSARDEYHKKLAPKLRLRRGMGSRVESNEDTPTDDRVPFEPLSIEASLRQLCELVELGLLSLSDYYDSEHADVIRDRRLFGKWGYHHTRTIGEVRTDHSSEDCFRASFLYTYFQRTGDPDFIDLDPPDIAALEDISKGFLNLKYLAQRSKKGGVSFPYPTSSSRGFFSMRNLNSFIRAYVKANQLLINRELDSLMSGYVEELVDRAEGMENEGGRKRMVNLAFAVDNAPLVHRCLEDVEYLLENPDKDKRFGLTVYRSCLVVCDVARFAYENGLYMHRRGE